ncbi:MAG: hypothetical protein J5850_03240 [Clostridia bacterium]|nr:hypothetical protein [Clostridia bacterium]
MKYSLLAKETDSPAECSILYDISADRAINRIEPDERKADYFLKILSSPLTMTSNIVYRQNVLKDLVNNPGMISELKKIFTRYDRIRTDWQQTKISAPDNSADVSSDALLEYSFSSLKAVAGFPSTIKSFFTSIGGLLSGYNVSSEAFLSIRDYCLSIVDSADFREIVEIALSFRHGEFSDFEYELSVKTDNELIPKICDIISVNEIKKQEGFIGKFFQNKKADPGDEITSIFSEPGDDPYSCSVSLLSSAFTRLDKLITEVTGALYETFFGISTELVFYEVAMSYISAAEEQGIAICYPEVVNAEKDIIDLCGMSELLLMSEQSGKKVVRNDLPVGDAYDGLIVRGMTDSGKTVYLRAIAEAQLFAQAGLPVLAEKAVLSVRHGFFSHFSSAEEEFLKKNARGRFDQEASELAAIISSIKPYSLLLLNETFQTTSYKEGTESIYNILKYMPYLKTKYVFVTHLVNLFDYMKNENVLLAQTSEDEQSKYKILFLNGAK